MCEAFDWRLSIPNMELRDGYFTRLRSSVETAHEMSGQKVVIVSHSYGENVVRSFYAWVEPQVGQGRSGVGRCAVVKGGAERGAFCSVFCLVHHLILLC